MNKKALCALFISIYLLPGFAAAQTGTQPHSPGIEEIYRAVSQITPRLEGSPSEKELVNYIRTFFESQEIAYSISDFSSMSGGHSYSVSLEVVIPGRSADELIVVAPLNRREDSANPQSGSLNIAIALEMARRYVNGKGGLTLRILFLGAEFGDNGMYPIGSNSFLSTYFPEGEAAILYLDFDYPSDRIVIRAGDRGDVTPHWLLRRCLSTLDSAGLTFLLRGNESQFFRLGFAENPAPIRAFLSMGYPAISFHSSRAQLPDNVIATWVASFMEFTDSMLLYESNPKEWDRHYLFFQVRGFSIIIRERTYIIILLSITGFLVLYPAVFSRRFRSYVTSLVKNFWALPALLVLVYFLLLIGTLLVEGLSLLKDYPGYWSTKPALFFVLKLSTAVFLFSLISRYVKRITFPRRGRFYSAAALVILVSDLFILGIMDISLAYYVLWACVWAFLFSLAPGRTLKALCLIISPAWLIKVAYDMFTIPVMDIAEDMILNKAAGNLIVAFIMFPFLLMLIRLDFMFRHPKRKTKRLLLTVVYIVLGVSCGGLGTYLAILKPFSANDRQPIAVEEVQDLSGDNGIVELKSVAALEGITVYTENGPERINSRSRSYWLPIPLRPNLMNVETTVRRFLGRATYSFTISSQGVPSEVAVELASEEGIVIYDSSFPFSFSSPTTVDIHIGKYPPNPLIVEITLPGNLTGTVKVEAGHADPPFDREISGQDIFVIRRLLVIDRHTFGETTEGVSIDN